MVKKSTIGILGTKFMVKENFCTLNNNTLYLILQVEATNAENCYLDNNFK